MTFATHPERQFMQYLRGAGWIKARTLPRSVRTVKSLLQKGWIEKQHQGPKKEVFFRLTEKGLEAKISPVPIQEQSRPAKGEEMSAPWPRWTPEEDGCSDRWGRLAAAQRQRLCFDRATSRA
jgi:hypothetical protein